MDIDYLINPVKMGGVVKDLLPGGKVKIYLNGRLGVIKVPRWLIRGDVDLRPGHEVEFYFSYLQLNEDPFDYDASDMTPDHEIAPCLLGGKLVDVNDTAVTIKAMNDLGEITVPRRWLVASSEPKTGLDAEFYFSCMNVTGKRDLPQRFI